MRKKSLIYLALLYAAVSIILTRFPLLNYLGYEFSVAIALVVSFVAGLTMITLIKKAPADKSSFDFSSLISASLRDNLLLLIIPLIVSTLNALLVKNCSYLEGIAFYISIPLVAVVFVIALASWCAVMFRRARTIYFLLLLANFLYPLYLGYATPQIYSYNFIYGFFPGFSYDEVLTISPTLILFRCATLLAAMFFILMSHLVVAEGRIDNPVRKKLKVLVRPGALDRNRIALLSVLLMLTGVWIERRELGFESSSQFIQGRLGKSFQTEHFFIWYSPSSFSDEEITWVAAEHEFRLEQVQSALKQKFGGRITSYIYPDEETKRRFIGTGTTNIAKPWCKEIHLNSNSWSDVLKHEIVHVVTGEFGMPVIHAHYHIGLVEGLAMAVDDDFGNRTLDEYATAMKKFEIIKHPEQLVSPIGFTTHSSSVSYVVMGSFIKYLINHHGMSKFKSLYGGTSVETVYEKSYDQLVDEWQSTLDRVSVPDSWRQHVDFFFRRPSIFAKECAREIAKQNERGWKNLSHNNSLIAIGSFSASLDKSWNTEAYGGLIRAAFQAAQYDTVVSLMDAVRNDSVRENSLINLLVLYGDALWNRGDVPSAKKSYEQIRSLDLSERLTEGVALRLAALDDSLLRLWLPIYFNGSLDESESLVLFDNLQKDSTRPLLHLLKARVLFQLKRYDDVIRELKPDSVLFDDSTLIAGKEQLLAKAYFRMMDFTAARRHFARSMASISNEASRRRMLDWLDRCEWYEKNARTYLPEQAN